MSPNVIWQTPLSSSFILYSQILLFLFNDSNMTARIWMLCIRSTALSESVQHLANIAIALCARLILKVKYNNISWFK